MNRGASKANSYQKFTNKFSEPGDWLVGSQPGSHQFNFQVLVNLKSERIKAEELRLPEVKGPPLKSATTAAANPALRLVRDTDNVAQVNSQIHGLINAMGERTMGNPTAVPS